MDIFIYITNNILMKIINRKSLVVFRLFFSTSKLLSYTVLVSSSILGYLLMSVDVVIVGLIVSASLSGVKNITESLVKLRPKFLMGGGINNDNEANEAETNKNKRVKKEREVL